MLNYISIEERLPTVFMPVSPPPYNNGGEEFLSWVIESTEPNFTSDTCAEWLEDRLPNPINDMSQWSLEDDDYKINPLTFFCNGSASCPLKKTFG